MNERLFTEMTGKRVRTAAESAKLYAERDEALKLRLRTLSKAEAVKVCHALIASPDTHECSKRICAEHLAANT